MNLGQLWLSQPGKRVVHSPVGLRELRVDAERFFVIQVSFRGMVCFEEHAAQVHQQSNVIQIVPYSLRIDHVRGFALLHAYQQPAQPE
jgi:hypothetical protein